MFVFWIENPLKSQNSKSSWVERYVWTFFIWSRGNPSDYTHCTRRGEAWSYGKNSRAWNSCGVQMWGCEVWRWALGHWPDRSIRGEMQDLHTGWRPEATINVVGPAGAGGRERRRRKKSVWGRGWDGVTGRATPPEGRALTLAISAEGRQREGLVWNILQGQRVKGGWELEEQK